MTVKAFFLGFIAGVIFLVFAACFVQIVWYVTFGIAWLVKQLFRGSNRDK